MMRKQMMLVSAVVLFFPCSVVHGETIKITNIITGKKNGIQQVYVYADATGTAKVTYRFRLEAQETGKAAIILAANTPITMLATGKFSIVHLDTANSTLKVGIKYKFTIKLFKGTDDPEKAKPLVTDFMDHTVSGNPLLEEEEPPVCPPPPCPEFVFSRPPVLSGRFTEMYWICHAIHAYGIYEAAI